MAPFEKHLELISKIQAPTSGTNAESQADTWIPNEPSVTGSDRAAVADFLRREFACPTIDDIIGHMHWVARMDGTHVDALHEAFVKRRTPIVTENPELHLVWHKDVIWIKPVPHCLFSYDFWMAHLAVGYTSSTTVAGSEANDGPSRRSREVLGFMRSYAHLIRHESDFRLAQEHRLVPKSVASHTLNSSSLSSPSGA